jgi:lactoylglutathione lyase
VITTSGHIAITASDFESSITFHRNILGLPEEFLVDREVGAIWMAYVKTGSNDFIEIFDGKGVAGEDSPEFSVKHICLGSMTSSRHSAT